MDSIMLQPIKQWNGGESSENNLKDLQIFHPDLKKGTNNKGASEKVYDWGEHDCIVTHYPAAPPLGPPHFITRSNSLKLMNKDPPNDYGCLKPWQL